MRTILAADLKTSLTPLTFFDGIRRLLLRKRHLQKAFKKMFISV